MSEFLRLAGRFRRDESGVFAVLFGVMAIVLVALGGAVVDYVTLEQTRSRAQTALDAAALALQPEIFKPGYSDDAVRALAQAIMIERIGDDRVTASIEQVTHSVEDGSLYFRARVSMPTMFVALVGVNTLASQVEAEATRKKLELEVVMVLDNSGSMQSESRMTRLVEAARCATYILMYDAVVPQPGNSNSCVPASGAALMDNVRVGIVPFTMYVNVGAANANAAWMDRFGASSIHFDNFDNDDDEDRLVTSMNSPNYSFPTRQRLFAATGEAWRGCVEARPHVRSGTSATAYLDTDDTPPTGGDTLFVPLFSPDTVNGGTNNFVADSPSICDRPAQGNTQCVITEQRTYSSRNGWSGASVVKREAVGPTNFVSSDLYPDAFYGRHADSCSCRTATTTSGWSPDSSNSNRETRTVTCNGYIPQGLSNRELQERVCKYYAGVSNSSFSVGPNAQCTRTAILPLTNNPNAVINTINAMQAEGGTNIHEGAAWGFRVLSPGEPFTEGGPYGEAISKVMIIMTDGENTAYRDTGMNGSSYFSAYGFPYNSMNNKAASTSGGTVERLGNPGYASNTGAAGVSNAHLVTAMNERTAQTCANAKNAGITVYTIGLATDKVTQSTTQVVQSMLTNCASTPDRARFPNQSSELKATFEAIANDLSALRLAR
jgi:Flp pilus assembly protein TadG